MLFDRCREMIMPVFLILAAGLTSGNLRAEYCALDLQVQTDGRSVRDLPVKVRDQSGRLIFDGIAPGGKRRICDIGLGNVEITIGWDGQCGQLTLGNIQARWGETLTLRPYLQDCPPEPMLKPDGCQILIRGRDPNGKPVEGVTLHGIIIGTRSSYPPRVTDSYGRVFFTLSLSSELEVTGHSPSTFTPLRVRCDSRGDRIEREFRLRAQ